MTLRSTATRYGLVAQCLHWITAALVLAAYVESVGGPEARVYSEARDGIRNVHETLGMVLFGVVLLRVLWRLADPPPVLHSGPFWIVRSARVVHVMLYVLLVLIPLTAIVGTWLEGHPLTLVGVRIDPWLPSSRALGQWVIDAHTISGNALMWLAALHTAAALLHHYRYRDGVLESMLPARWRRTVPAEP